MRKERIVSVCNKFGIKKVNSVKKLAGGIMSETYKINDSLVLQKLPEFFDHRTALNAYNLTNFLRRKSFALPGFLTAKKTNHTVGKMIVCIGCTHLLTEIALHL